MLIVKIRLHLRPYTVLIILCLSLPYGLSDWYLSAGLSGSTADQ